MHIPVDVARLNDHLPELPAVNSVMDWARSLTALRDELPERGRRGGSSRSS